MSLELMEDHPPTSHLGSSEWQSHSFQESFVTMGKRKEASASTQAGKRKKSLPTSDVDATAMRRSEAPSQSSGTVDAGSASSKPRRALRRRSTDEAVERCIQTKLQGISKQAIETQPLPCGRLLRVKLSEDISSSRGQPGSRLGAKYWRGIRSFLGQVDELQKLKPDPKLTVDKGMMAALEQMCVINASLRSPERMLAWLRTTDTINERELIGVFKICSSPKKTTHAHAMEVVVATLRMVAEKSSLDKFTHVFTAAKDLLDEALTSNYNAARKNGVNRETWLEARRVFSVCFWPPGVARVLLPPACHMDFLGGAYGFFFRSNFFGPWVRSRQTSQFWKCNGMRHDKWALETS